MNDATELLRDADPLRREPAVSLEQRSLHRQVIVSAVSIPKVELRHRPRALVLVAAAAMIVASFLGSWIWTSFTPPVQAAVRFEVRLAEDKSAPGLREAKVTDSGRSIYLHDEVVVSNGDIAAARSIQVERHYRVSVTFTRAGAERMKAATKGNIGKVFAILLDGRVVMAPVIRSSIEGEAVITGNLTKAQAQSIVDGITKP